MQQKKLLLPLLFSIPSLAIAQEVYLDTVELIEKKDTIERITQSDMERKNASNLWEALKGASGVNLQYTGSNRNNSHASIRGLSDTSICIYLDGIPVATTWRQENDYSRISTFDLESIEISKGYSSTLLGTGGMADVINMRTAKPTRDFEVKAKYTNHFDRSVNDQGQGYGLSVGTKQELFYLKGSFYQEEQRYFKLPSGFESTAYESGPRRYNSDWRDRKYSFIAGVTPSEDVDIYMGYSNQDAKKGFPANIYDGSRYARWPKWNSERVFLNADAKLTDKAYVKGGVYYDKHKDESRYSTLANPSVLDTSFSGIYDDYAYGGRLEGGYAFNDMHQLALSGAYRIDSHKRKNLEVAGMANPGKTVDDVKDNVIDLGMEYTLKPIDPLTFVFGVAYTDVKTKHVHLDMTNKNLVGSKPSYDAFNWQIGTFYDVTPDDEIFFTMAKKTRMPTMRERYSNGRNVADPTNHTLKPEKAMHYELGYRGTFDNAYKLKTSVFYSDVKDLIDSDSNRFYRNMKDKIEFYGAELSLEAMFNRYVTIGASVNYLDWKNKTGFERLTNRTHASGSFYGVVSPLDNLSFVGRVDSSTHWWDSDTQDMGGYADVSLKAVYDVNKNFTVEMGAENLLDKQYQYDYGYPVAGRSYFAGMTMNF